MGFEFHEAEFHRNCWRINNYVLSAGFHCVSWITEPTELIIGADLALRAGWFRFITTSSVTDRIGKIEYKLQQSRITESPLIYIATRDCAIHVQPVYYEFFVTNSREHQKGLGSINFRYQSVKCSFYLLHANFCPALVEKYTQLLYITYWILFVDFISSYNSSDVSVFMFFLSCDVEIIHRHSGQLLSVILRWED